MIRIFTGLAVPPDISASLALLRGGLPGARWVEPSDYHVTLQFAGNIEESVAADLHEALSRIRKPPVEIILDGLHAFGGSKPRSIVTAVRATPSLLDLQASHERIFKRLNIDFDARKYVPHITIARLKAISAANVAEFIEARGYVRPLIFECDKFVLYSSGKSAGGGPYVAEAEYELRA